MKVALIGSTGQLGSDIIKIFTDDKSITLIPLTHNDIEITNLKQTNQILSSIKPQIIINTSAFHKVEICEKEVEKSFNINALAPRNLALYAKQTNSIIVQLSTDYVFGLDENRKKPYSENDTVGPINAYGISKLAGECFIRYIAPKYFIVRSASLFGIAGASGKGGNFIETMLKKAPEGVVKVVNDQTMTPTSTVNLAQNLLQLIKTTEYGLYHMTSEGQCTWYEFAKEIFKQAKKKVKVIPITTSQSKSAVKRPTYSVLENKNLKKIKLDLMNPWEDNLHTYLVEKKYINR